MDAVEREKEKQQRAKEELKAADIRFCDNLLMSLSEALLVTRELRDGLEELKLAGLDPKFINVFLTGLNYSREVLGKQLTPIEKRLAKLSDPDSLAYDLPAFHKTNKHAIHALSRQFYTIAKALDQCYSAAQRHSAFPDCSPSDSHICNSFCKTHEATASKLRDIADSLSATHQLTQKIIDLNAPQAGIEGR